ncbi:MFS transporter [Amycolatopsis sp. WGS_07]|uniref:MFS transporter n=1 Tax=Amycolatopsis sp. WGS_07 TaxID=3076764 RepID=UPI0038731E9A
MPQRHYSRASGLLSLALSVAGVVGPATATLVLSHGGLSTVFAIDLATYAFCALALTAVAKRVREPAPTARRRGLRHDVAHGFHYIASWPGLRALQTLFFLAYFATMFGVLISPMVLARSGAAGTAALAAVLGAAGAGGIVGGAVTALWGRRRGHLKVILPGFVLIGLLGQIPLGASASPAVWMAASFVGAFLYPLVEAANQALWQSSTPLSEQGRIFAARRVLTESAGVTVLLIAGPLADGVFEPGMREPGRLRSAFGWLTGTGPGSGMAVLLLLSGVLTALAGLWGLTVRALRDLDRLPPTQEHRPENSMTIKER